MTRKFLEAFVIVLFTLFASQKWRTNNDMSSSTHVNPNTPRNERNNRLLLLACSKGNKAEVKKLIESGKVDVNFKDKFGDTALLCASRSCRHGYYAEYGEIVQILLSQPGIDVNCKDNYSDYTPLSWASRNGHVEVVQMLLDQPGIEINCKNEKNGYTPLIWASQNGHVEVVRLLLGKSGIEINCADKDGSTPLILASRGGHVEIVQILLSQPGIEVNHKDKYGKTALDWARWMQYKQIVELLEQREQN